MFGAQADRSRGPTGYGAERETVGVCSGIWGDPVSQSPFRPRLLFAEAGVSISGAPPGRILPALTFWLRYKDGADAIFYQRRST